MSVKENTVLFFSIFFQKKNDMLFVGKMSSELDELGKQTLLV